ncbi:MULTISPECIES: GspH/FimT family protein [unclassified Acinetobacter]|uniref:GspH/FimT family protein n=1 Tax=unclassified Acinetobacter TaxID=196816 RepID=UPI0015D1BD63|nr:MULTISPECIES: GspH/FimT family protein [unclassified Acinetobacter]
MFYIIKNGFTLFEIIITILIIAIITTIALPHFHKMMAEREIKKVKATIISSSHYARNHASLYHANIVICPTPDLKQCQSSHWNTGFLIFIDQNKNRQVDSNEKILYQEALNLKYGDLNWRGTLSTPSLTFQALSGLPIGSNGSFYYCSKSDLPHQRIIMSKMAHIRIENPSTC